MPINMMSKTFLLKVCLIACQPSMTGEGVMALWVHVDRRIASAQQPDSGDQKTEQAINQVSIPPVAHQRNDDAVG